MNFLQRLRVAVSSRVLYPLRRVAELSGLDSSDAEAVTAVLVYLALATVIVAWASSMYLLVRAITGA